MFGNLTVGKRLLAAFSVAVVTLALIAAVSYFNVNRQIENDGWVRHTYEVRSALDDLVEELLNCETAVRGFVISGEDSFLAPYTSALGSISATVDNLRKLTSDNPHQQQRLALLQPLLDTKMKQFQERIDAYRVLSCRNEPRQNGAA